MKNISDDHLLDILRRTLETETELNDKISAIILSAKDPGYVRSLDYYKDQLHNIQLVVKMLRFSLARSENTIKRHSTLLNFLQRNSTQTTGN